jgi:hypothetical protein
LADRTAVRADFTNEDGIPLHPAAVTDMFERIAYLAGPRSRENRHGSSEASHSADIYTGRMAAVAGQKLR